MRSSFSLALTASIAAAALLAACGGSPTQDPNTPATPSATSTGDTDAPPANTGDAPPADTGGGPATPPPAAKMFPDVVPSKMGDKLKAIGLDINNLKPFSKMKTAEKTKVMKLFNEAVGYKCNGCHADGDFKKETRQKQIARHMWDDYTVKYKLANGPVFCDSCHTGSAKNLDRGDKDKIKSYMDAQFTKKLVLKDGGDVSCTTCHTEDFEMEIFEEVWKVKK